MGNRKSAWNPVLRPDVREEARAHTKPRWLVQREEFVNAAEGVVTYRNDAAKQCEAFIKLLATASAISVDDGEGKNPRLAALAHVRNNAARKEIFESKDCERAFDVFYTAACAVGQVNGMSEREARGFAGAQVRGTRAFARAIKNLGDEHQQDMFLRKHGLIANDADEGFIPSVSMGNMVKLLEALEKDGKFSILNGFKEHLPQSWIPREAKKDGVETLLKTFEKKGQSKVQAEPKS
ncbi:hypothetical protein A3G55_02405 [Candidatus Giovannonibacteria bacterium RIFCSPLOWO2_12_FULL_44_25]|uniref:Uncharacterized protein n=4 Tax=Parcubacteria group TaxID=1794811 RepID=A0A837IH89_9BACT|nr:MAG: hypothetical protein UW15_C0001G0008 [Parcubacteria group bacterium GW2011_GWC1_44_10]KKT57529.1 MAG: hypothetical protein UW49_C0003G0008 [Candidatus Giovannonibacteria bacterium GW2011_GWB1_44_23]KKT59790.1 MAG: hypothetical protein UW53_C0007G0008 [Candidatus Giovannonibacteria bacterium GW2011_GWA1_44_25]KKU13117.1 MAG: hypothetical protein UX18_C0001G0008 [Candidatus Azambacteria bacterium GW2011_GWC2_45_7b]OGF49521.1 MAG: hypothetical protein A2120_00905 [Candidatus Giovannonibact